MESANNGASSFLLFFEFAYASNYGEHVRVLAHLSAVIVESVRIDTSSSDGIGEESGTSGSDAAAYRASA